MIDWLRLLLMMFYAPSRALGEVRDSAPLAPAMLIALLAQASYELFSQRLYSNSGFILRGVLTLFVQLFQSASSLLFIALVFVPVTALVANLFERRGSFGLMLRQEYAALASAVFYAWAAANVIAIPLAFLGNISGVQEASIANSVEMTRRLQERLNFPPEAAAILSDPQTHARMFFRMIVLPLFGAWSLIAIRETFRLSWVRTISILFVSCIVVYVAAIILMPLFGWVLASPFLLLILFFLVRGYIGEVMRTARARASFKQNLEAATLNPADASAHYNLGLIHQQRNELDAARQRFERAVEIDADEVDAHYQLGRIARAQNDLPEAIKHFEQVVGRDQAHAQHEIWREIGATYLAAGQFEDARSALERFLERRQSDPEGLYLMGRAHAGLGHQRAAVNSMQACIEAVKTAPAYKYRTEKRWLNEAQQFLRSQTS